MILGGCQSEVTMTCSIATKTSLSGIVIYIFATTKLVIFNCGLLLHCALHVLLA